MAAPQPYVRSFDFASYQNANPTRPLPGVNVNIELNELKRVTDQIIAYFGVTGSGSGGEDGSLPVGTSGGVPFYADSSTIGASAELGLNRFVLGGGPGAGPSTNAMVTQTASAALNIAPTAASNIRGFNITQTSDTDLISGPRDFNKIYIENTGGASFPGGDPFRTDEARGLHVHMKVGGAGLKGFQNAARFRLDHTLDDSDISFGDHIGVVTIAYSTKDGAGKGLYSLNDLVWADDGAVHQHVVGNNVESGVSTTATVSHRTAFRAQHFDEGHGSLSDAAFSVFKSDTGEGFKNVILLNEWNGNQSVHSAGNLISSYGPLTTANGFKFDNITFTGDLLLAEHYKLTGAGVVTVNLTTTAAITPPTGTQMHLVGAGTYGLTIDAYNGGEGALHLRRANSVIGSPAALATDNLIGAVDFIGYHSGGAYTTNGRAAIFGHAGENWTNTAQGAYIDFYTTPLTSATRARAVRITPAGGISIGHTGNTAIGSIAGTGSAIFNSFLASGGVGLGNGELRLGGNTAQNVVQTVQATAGNATVTWGTSSGTPAVTASAPLAINTATGDIGFDSVAWTTFTPTMSWGGGGTPSAFTATGAYKIMGKTVFVWLRLVLTTANGVNTSFTFGGLPFTLAFTQQWIGGVEYQTTGLEYRGIATTTTAIQCKKADNTWAAPGDGERYHFQGVLELA